MCPDVKAGGSVGLGVKYEDLKVPRICGGADKAVLTLCKSKELKEPRKTCP